jgi:hypothetical protein
MTVGTPASDLSRRLYILTHQVFFLLSGLCQTLGAQWLFYQGAASKYNSAIDRQEMMLII